MRKPFETGEALLLFVAALGLLLVNAAMMHGCARSPASRMRPSGQSAPESTATAKPTPAILNAPSAPPDVAPECWHEGAKEGAHFEAPCSGVCSSFRVVPKRCENGHWRELSPIEPSCACVPESTPASLRDCKARSIVLTPTDEGASDGVKLMLACGKTLLDVECDGENDGTGTSLCSCHRDGIEVRIPGDPWPGEGISVAYRVAERCLAKK